MSIDTLSLARELRAADFDAAQAEAIAAAIGRAVVETAATKADVQHSEAVLRSEIQGLSSRIDAVDMRQGSRSDTLASELRAEIEKTRSSLLVWFISTQVAVGALIVALVKLIPQV